MSCLKVSNSFSSLALLLIAIAAWHLILPASRAKSEEPKPSKVKELLRERLVLLREIASQTTKAYRSGENSFESVHLANQAVLQAEIEMCESIAEKVSLLVKAVVLAKQLEAATSELVKAREAPASVAIKAKVSRLEAEIALERAKEE